MGLAQQRPLRLRAPASGIAAATPPIQDDQYHPVAGDPDGFCQGTLWGVKKFHRRHKDGEIDGPRANRKLVGIAEHDR